MGRTPCPQHPKTRNLARLELVASRVITSGSERGVALITYKLQRSQLEIQAQAFLKEPTSIGSPKALSENP